MTEDSDAKSGYKAPALEKGLEILEYLSDRSHPHAMAEIAKAVGRSRNEIYRMLVVLERRGYLVRTADDRYELSNRLFDLGMRTPPLRNLHDAAMPSMHELAEVLMQSCHLVVASGAEMVVVARVESPDQLGFAVRVGYRLPIVASTSGRVLFSRLPVERQRAMAATIAAGASAEHFDRFERDARKAEGDGYFAGPSIVVDGVTDIGAPVLAGEDGPVAALVVPFVSGRLARVSLNDAIIALKRSTAEISARLTHG